MWWTGHEHRERRLCERTDYRSDGKSGAPPPPRLEEPEREQTYPGRSAGRVGAANSGRSVGRVGLRWAGTACAKGTRRPALDRAGRGLTGLRCSSAAGDSTPRLDGPRESLLVTCAGSLAPAGTSPRGAPTAASPLEPRPSERPAPSCAVAMLRRSRPGDTALKALLRDLAPSLKTESAAHEPDTPTARASPPSSTHAAVCSPGSARPRGQPGARGPSGHGAHGPLPHQRRRGLPTSLQWRRPGRRQSQATSRPETRGRLQVRDRHPLDQAESPLRHRPAAAVQGPHPHTNLAGAFT